MKRSFLNFLIAILLTQLCHAQQSAYEALRALNSAMGGDLLSRVVEVEGLHGTAQPKIWKITVDAPTTRGGIREFEVKGGLVISERTPYRNFAKTYRPFDTTKLNLDSTGAFTAALNFAGKQEVAFDSVDYLLTTFSEDREEYPCWELKLVDVNGSNVGIIRISAITGKIIQTEGLVPQGKLGLTSQNEAEDTATPTRKKPGIQVVGEKVGSNVKKGVLIGAGAVQEFFTGERTIDQEYQNR